MKKYDITNFEADHRIAKYYLADEVDSELVRLQRIEHLAGVLLYELDTDGDVQSIAKHLRDALQGKEGGA